MCSEANDMAMMMARLYTHNHDIITLRNAYHGLSGGWVGAECGWWVSLTARGVCVSNGLGELRSDTGTGWRQIGGAAWRSSKLLRSSQRCLPVCLPFCAHWSHMRRTHSSASQLSTCTSFTLHLSSTQPNT